MRKLSRVLVLVLLVVAGARTARAQTDNTQVAIAGGVVGGVDLGFIVADIVMAARHRPVPLAMATVELMAMSAQLATGISFVATASTGQHMFNGQPEPDALLPVGALFIAASVPLLLHAVWAIHRPNPNAGAGANPGPLPQAQPQAEPLSRSLQIAPTLVVDAGRRAAVLGVIGRF